MLSRIIRLSVTYDEAVDAPGSLILNTVLPNRVGGLFDPGQREVEFYTQVAGVMSTRIFPRCFDADWDPTAKTWHLLLEDLRKSDHCAKSANHQHRLRYVHLKTHATATEPRRSIGHFHSSRRPEAQ